MTEAALTEEEVMRNLKDLLDYKNRLIENLKKQISSQSGELDRLVEHRRSTENKTSCYCSCHTENSIKPVRDADTQTFESEFFLSDSTGSALDWTVDAEKNVSVSDVLQRAIEKQSFRNDYVFDENYNMYYSPSTGYYYDSERNLLYEPYSQTYYKYSDEKQMYEVYYQVAYHEKSDAVNVDSTQVVADGVDSLKLNDCSVEESNANHMEIPARREKKLMEGKSKHCREPKSSREDLTDQVISLPSASSEISQEQCSSPEEGEIFTDSEASMSEDESYCIIQSPSVIYTNKNEWPPCIRAIVKESCEQRIGSLLLITCTGGIIGREESSEICIPDISISRAHAKIKFDNDSWQYCIQDLGSQNGTFVNDVRVVMCKEENLSAHVLNHGDILRLGSFKLLIHIHPGSDTCNECEPGQVQAELKIHKRDVSALKSKEEKVKERKQQLKLIKKKFGLQGMEYDAVSNMFKTENYEDRAENRRKTKGSQNPYEKNVQASVEESMPSFNKGYKMLKNMGWSEGQSLGSSSDGITEPVTFQQRRQDRSGLGIAESLPLPQIDRKARKWRKAQKRYYEMQDK